MSETYRLGEVAELLGVSVDTVRRWADRGLLGSRRTEAGHRLIDAADLARFMAARAPGEAPDVTVANSARNRFPGVVTRVVKDAVMAQVDIQAGPHRVVSLMSREAADELALAPGVRAVAAVKATNVTVELHEPN